MFVVITGLDGSGTSTLANKIHEIDKESYVLKTPSYEFSDRDSIDKSIKPVSSVAHMLYYLSSTVYMSDYIKKNFDISRENVYLVRYLIDTVVSNRVAGIPIELDYNIYGNNLLIPDATLFITLDEQIRQSRITERGKSVLDKVLDDEIIRQKFLMEFKKNLDSETTLYISNDGTNISEIAQDAYEKILKLDPNKKGR